MSQLIPEAKDVKLTILDVKVLSEKEGEPRNWRSLIVKFRVPDAVVDSEIGDFWEGTTDDIPDNTGKVLSKFITYYANPDSYDSSADWFAKGWFLSDLKSLTKALNLKLSLVKGGITDEAAEALAEDISNKEIMGNIKHKFADELNPETGKYERTTNLVEDVVALKALPESALI